MFERIKNWRGLFWRKLAEAQEKEKAAQEAMPGFALEKTTHIVDFPTVTDITKVNITYPLIEPFAYVQILWDPNAKELVYNVIEPKLSEEERKLLKRITDGLIELVDVELSAVKEPQKAIEYLRKNVGNVVREFGIVLDQNTYLKMMYYIYRNFLGFNDIEPLLQDPNIEDISCDGVETPMYIIHRKFGSLKTNLSFQNLEILREFIIKLAERTGRYVSYAEPILAGTLPDGSRISATLAGDVATRGPTFTIRKFGEKPFSPVDQMELGTANPEILAYFWYLMEHGISLLIVGGVATGKTSFLNTLAMFIPPEAKIVSIEDTRELRLPHEHWVPGLARVGFGIPTPSGEKYGEVTLFDLLKESFRQNPDYVIVGEVRGAEAYVMFQGMSSGHPSISTFHAGSIDTMIKRLTTPPIELSPSLIESLDVVAIMTHAKEKGKSARRIKEIVEIESVDPKSEEVNTRMIFKWDPINDTYEKVDPSLKIEEIAASKGGTIADALTEIERRKRVLMWMKETNIKDYNKITQYINLYYKEPQKLFEEMGQDLSRITAPSIPTQAPSLTFAPEKREMPVVIEARESPVIAEKKKEKRGRVSLLSLLGFKVIHEK
ncbi:MAG TPA: type II/IV secretion system ATPase subunit [archaeon]|nr:type II/IV secretion system ATPase subunit [archaeon]